MLVDVSVKSQLDWTSQIKQAEQLSEIIWELDLGLGGSLSDHARFLSLKLSLEHFVETLWKPFQEKTKGVIFYRGSPDFSDLFAGKDVFTLRNEVSEYLELLAGFLPEELVPEIHFDLSKISDKLLAARLTTKECYPHFQLLEKDSTVGICLPSISYEGSYDELSTLFNTLEHYRVIPEPLIASEWKGLDTLYVLEKTLTPQGKRMLQGFIAAGGNVILQEKNAV